MILERVIFPPCGEDDPATPPEQVARLTRPQREQRVRWLTLQSHRIADEAVDRWLNVVVDRKTREERPRPRTLVATCVLFSGGNDSTTLAHMMRERATHALHANTRVGIEATRQYVRDTCASWDLELIERSAPKAEDHYENMVVERGFPGFASHWLYYARLMERALDECRGPLGIRGSTKRAALWLAGRRRSESDRRSGFGDDPGVPLNQYDGSVIWASPLAHWTKLDLNTYRLIHPDVPRNEVSDLLHMSGECLCGAAAKPGELERLAQWFPVEGQYLRDLQDKVRAAGHPEELCQWGHGLTGRQIAKLTGRRIVERAPGLLCGDCRDETGGEVIVA